MSHEQAIGSICLHIVYVFAIFLAATAATAFVTYLIRRK